jgi:hypothetical protein
VLRPDQARPVVTKPHLASRLGQTIEDVVHELGVASDGIDVLIVKSHRVILPLRLARYKDDLTVQLTASRRRAPVVADAIVLQSSRRRRM